MKRTFWMTMVLWWTILLATNVAFAGEWKISVTLDLNPKIHVGLPWEEPCADGSWCNGTAGPGFLGIEYETVDTGLLHGALDAVRIVRVYPQSPADWAGLYEGDQVLFVEKNSRFYTVGDIQRVFRAGDTIELYVIRRGRTIERIPVTLVAWNDALLGSPVRQ